jgi:WD40 repeat protein
MEKQAKKVNSNITILSFCPGTDPVGNMEDAFIHAHLRNINQESNENKDRLFSAPLDGDPDWIITALRSLSIGPAEKVLINVDQFEELFAYNSTQKGFDYYNKASEFVTLLLNTLKQSFLDIYIVISLNSDYLADCAHLHGLTQLINNSNFLLPEISQENYKKIIEKPFYSEGISIDPELVVTILDDLEHSSCQLPVLQHVLMRTCAHWQDSGNTDRPVDTTDYAATGKMESAISVHADEIFMGLNDEAKQICKRLFKAITGKSADNKGIKHPLKISSIKSILHCPVEDLFDVIEKFRQPTGSFIKPWHNIPLNDDTIADVSYDFLINCWDGLKEWIEEEADSARTYIKLSEASAMFQKGKTTLLKNPELQAALNWRDDQKPTLEWAERYDPVYERAMVYLRTSEKAFKEEEEIINRSFKKKARRNWLIKVVLGFSTLLLLGLFLYAFSRKLVSDRQKSEAMSRALLVEQHAMLSAKLLNDADSTARSATINAKEATEMNKISENRKIIAERIAIDARREEKEAEKKAMNEAGMKEKAIRQRMISVGKSLSLRSMQLTGQKELQALLAYQAYLFNKSNGGSANDADIFNGLYNVAKIYGNVNYRIFTGHEGEIKSIAFIPGKNQFFTSGSDGKILKWDLDGKNQNIQVVYSGSEIINVMAVSPDAGWLACGGQNSGIIVIPLKSNSISYELKGHTGPVKSLIFSYDGKYLYSASLDGKILRWDLASKTSSNISVSVMQTVAIDLSSDNKYIAGVGSNGKAFIFNPEAVTDTFTIQTGGKNIRSMRFKPYENKLAIGYSNGYVELWDIDKKEIISSVRAHTGAVNDIRFNTKLPQMATAGDDKSVRLWDINDLTSLPVIFDDNEGFVVTLAFSPDGQAIISGTIDSARNLTSRPTSAEILAKDLCSVLSRNLTTEEWWAYVGKDIEYSKTCPESEFKIKIDVLK